ncbi:MAG: hypothetical protein ABSF95_09870 [Verrucomicrobiota bacterium]|jgi:hypothetical protein
MNSIATLTPQQLRHAADLQEKIQFLQKQLQQLLGPPPAPASAPKPKRRYSPRAIANMRAGARKRWANHWRVRAAAAPARKPKRKVSPAGRAALSAAARLRWARAKAAGRTRL